MKISDIPNKRLNDLNAGVTETKNLTEWLAIDQKKLLLVVSEELKSEDLKNIARKIPKVSVPKQIAWIGFEIKNYKNLSYFQKHTSDVVRCWSCYAIASKTKTLKQSLKAIKPFAKDRHFGLREIAWMALREQICESPQEAVKLLLPWAKDKDENIRRFASEATRPRGVWAKHIAEFKNDPKSAAPLLNQLYSDKSRYVQDSVGNWLNDSAKDNPKWVKSIVSEWKKKSDSAETLYIIKRATRSMK